MKIVLKIISYIFAFILMLTLLVVILSQIVTNTILDENYLLAKLKETNYYSKARDNALVKVEDYIEQSGLEGLKMSEIFTLEQVKEDANSFFSGIYHSEKLTLNKDKLKQTLENKVEELEQNGTMTLTVTEKRSADQVLDIAVNSYFSEVSYGSFISYIENAPKLVSTINSMIFKVQKAVSIAVCVLIIVILLINIKQFKLGLRYIGTSVFASSVFMIGINIFVKIKMNIPNFYILNNATSDLVVNVALDVLRKISLVGIVGMIVGAIFIIIGATYKKEKSKQEIDY